MSQRNKKQKLAEQAKREQEEMRQQYMKDFILLYMLRRLEQQMQDTRSNSHDKPEHL